METTQLRFGPPPVEVVNMSMRRTRGLWELHVTARREGEDVWSSFTLSDLHLADVLEAAHTELERRLLG
jgi:hypothetical protein